MEYKSLLSVGEEFDYPLNGRENLYEILPMLNERFSIDLTTDKFKNCYVKNVPNGNIGLVAISKDNNEVYIFNNKIKEKLESFSYSETDFNKIKLIKPVDFKEELDFLKTIPTNTMVSYDLTTSKIIVDLWRLLLSHSEESWDIVGTDKSVDKFILRYYGPGDQVPSKYGIFDVSLTVSIIDLKRQNKYVSYCLRNKLYHVYNNGYRLRY